MLWNWRLVLKEKRKQMLYDYNKSIKISFFFQNLKYEGQKNKTSKPVFLKLNKGESFVVSLLQ